EREESQEEVQDRCPGQQHCYRGPGHPRFAGGGPGGYGGSCAVHQRCSEDLPVFDREGDVQEDDSSLGGPGEAQVLLVRERDSGRGGLVGREGAYRRRQGCRRQALRVRGVHGGHAAGQLPQHHRKAGGRDRRRHPVVEEQKGRGVPYRVRNDVHDHPPGGPPRQGGRQAATGA
ncbi:unnamed protein product, partial [Ectocarpus sp. 13 AM-2016]